MLGRTIEQIIDDRSEHELEALDPQTLNSDLTAEIPDFLTIIISGVILGPPRANRELEMDLGEVSVFLVRYGKTEYVVGQTPDGTYHYKLREELPLGFHLQDYPIFDITPQGFKEMDEKDESMNGFKKAFENFCKSHRATKIQPYVKTRIENN